MNVDDAFNRLRSSMVGLYSDREATIIAGYLIEDLLHLPKHSMQSLRSAQCDLIEDAGRRLALGEPWQYITGEADFYGLKFYVDQSVLIPRPETEELVGLAMGYIRAKHLSSILDIGTGSGIIPVAIGKKLTFLNQIYAVDISEAALALAERNAHRHSVNVSFQVCDILDENGWLQLPQIEVVISNPPYITRSEQESMHKNVLDYEPHLALFSDTSEQFYDAISRMVVEHQMPGCCVVFEINEHYAHQIVEVITKNGLQNVQVHKDMQGKDRMITAFKP